MYYKLVQLPYLGHSPTQLFEAFVGQGAGYIWESSQNKITTASGTSHRGGRFSYIGIEPKLTLEVRNNFVRCIREESKEQFELFQFGNDPLNALAAMPEMRNCVGFLSYDAARYFEPIKGLKVSSHTPDAFFVSPGFTIVIDHHEKTISLTTDSASSLDQDFVTRFSDYLEHTPVRSFTQPSRLLNSPVLHSSFEFPDAVNTAKEYILAGDAFQIVLGQYFVTQNVAKPLQCYDQLKHLNPSPYHFLLRFGGNYLVGASPEMFLQSAGDSSRLVRMRPVAGTYPTSNSASASELSQRLICDPKELAEHIMLVDHARNDIGRVSKIGSVAVRDLYSVETYRDVHHIVSEVSGNLKDEESIFSAIRSCFPIATLTGTPKIRAMEIIAEIENSARGLFGGSIFKIDGEAIDSAVIIRSAVLGEDGVSVWTGAGIVADSDPQRENYECGIKASAVISALENPQ